MKNKRVKQMMFSVLYERDFETEHVHVPVNMDFPMLTCWNRVLKKEQFSSMPSRMVSIKGKV